MDKRDVPTLLKGFRRSLGPPSASRPGDRAEVRADRDRVRLFSVRRESWFWHRVTRACYRLERLSEEGYSPRRPIGVDSRARALCADGQGDEAPSDSPCEFFAGHLPGLSLPYAGEEVGIGERDGTSRVQWPRGHARRDRAHARGGRDLRRPHALRAGAYAQ